MIFQPVMILSIVAIVLFLILILLRLIASSRSKKSMVKYHQLGEDFYCVEDKEEVAKDRKEKQKEDYIETEDFNLETPLSVEDLIETKPRKIAFINKLPGKRKPIKKKKGGKK